MYGRMQLLVILSLIFTAIHDSEALGGCQTREHRLDCHEYTRSYLPLYRRHGQVSWIYVSGMLSKISVSSGYKHLVNLHIRSSQLREFPLYSSQYACEELQNMTRLTDLTVDHSNLTRFDFKCLPKSIVHLNLMSNRISVLTSLPSLANLTQLDQLDLQSNLLATFDFSYFHDRLATVRLWDNYLTAFDPSVFTRDFRWTLAIFDNHFNCNCTVLFNYIRLRRRNVIQCADISEREKYCFLCGKGSYLADYPWSTNLTHLQSYDDNSKQCLRRQCVISKTRKQRLQCRNFQLTYLQYREEYANVTVLHIKGKFKRLAISSGFTNVVSVRIISASINEFPAQDKEFFGMEECEALKNLTSLDELYLTNGDLSTFWFECLPPNITHVQLKYNRISAFSGKSRSALLAHPSLVYIGLMGNKLQTFYFDCLPKFIKGLNLRSNDLEDLNFRDLQRFPLLKLALNDNTLHCTCTHFLDLIRLEQTKNENLKFPWHFNCSETSALGRLNVDQNLTDVTMQAYKLKLCYASVCFATSYSDKHCRGNWIHGE